MMKTFFPPADQAWPEPGNSFDASGHPPPDTKGLNFNSSQTEMGEDYFNSRFWVKTSPFESPV